MPSGKRSKQVRKAAPPPPVRSSGAGGQVSRRTLLIGAAVIALVALGIGLAVGLSGGGKSSASTPADLVDFSKIAGLKTGPPPWDTGSVFLNENLPIVHLTALPSEGAVIHIHQHLDVYVNGKPVTVPAQIGFYGQEFLTEIHTHDSLGIIHVESPTQRTFSLGEFFGEWGVLLSKDCLGRYCGDLHWWLDGKPQTGNPANLTLAQHQVIVIAVGKAPKNIPSTFPFAKHGV
jgi:hypothetical protein